MMHGGVKFVILALVSLTGVDLRAQHFNFDYDNFGSSSASVSTSNSFASASSSVVFSDGGFFESRHVPPGHAKHGNNGNKNKNNQGNGKPKGNGRGKGNKAAGKKRSNATTNVMPNEFAANPFLHDAVANQPPPPTPHPKAPKKPTAKRPSPTRQGSKAPKKPARPAVAPTSNNKKKTGGGGNNRPQPKGKKRVSEIKYEQYVASIFPDAGQAMDDVTDFNGRELARPGQFPHMGAIGFTNTVLNKTEYKCGASLISEYFVITSAHCTDFNGLPPTFVRFGDLNLRAAEEDIDPQTRRVAQIINHPDYKDDSLYNDIALLELGKPVIFTEFVRPIRLWHHENIPFTNAFAMGFGAVQFAGAATNRLTLFNLTIIPNDVCGTLLPKQPSANDGIVDTQICAIDYKKTGSDTFQGDSGGPLQVSFFGRRRGRLHEHLIGITSFGVLGLTRYPGVYTRISSFIEWIEQIAWSNDYYGQ